MRRSGSFTVALLVVLAGCGDETTLPTGTPEAPASDAAELTARGPSLSLVAEMASDPLLAEALAALSAQGSVSDLSQLLKDAETHAMADDLSGTAQAVASARRLVASGLGEEDALFADVVHLMVEDLGALLESIPESDGKQLPKHTAH